METPKENKAAQPKSNKQVRIRIKPGRSVQGLGGPGTEHPVDEREAKRLVKIGYAQILKES